MTPSGRSGYRGDPLNQNRNSALLPSFPHIKDRKAMGNAPKTARTKSPVRRSSSSSNSVSRNSKLMKFEFGSGSSVPNFARKSQDSASTTSTLNGSVKLRRNSSDSGYNSSEKACEAQIETGLSDGLQRVNLHNTSCGGSNYGQFSRNKTSTYNYDSSFILSTNKLERSKPSVSCGSKETLTGRSSRQTSLDLENTKPRSYVSDTSILSKSPMSSVPEGLVGLQNLGNTCFMNSILQCLSHCRPLRDKMLSSTSSQCNRQSKMKGKLYTDFAELIKAMWSKNKTRSAISPHTFKTQFQRFCPRFVGYEQQDSQEFLRCLLEGLNEDLNKAVGTPRRSGEASPDLSKFGDKALADYMWKQYKTRDNSLVTDIFCGQIMSTLTCKKCNHRSVTFDPFWDLSLSIPRHSYDRSYSDSSVTLVDCLKQFTKEEELDGDEKPKCEKCRTRQRCEKQFKIHRFPRILVIHLKRFSGFGFRSKLQTDVDFPSRHLDMSQFASEHSDEFSKRDSPEIKYNLFAVSNHSGSAYGGHYTAYCKHPESEKWHSFNDSRVSPLSSSSVRGSQAYVLFYERAEIQT